MIEVEDLSCRRGEAVILRGVSFRAAPGEAVILRGPNGSGKTTLLRTLAGLCPRVSGRIEAPVDGIAYAGHADGLKSQLSVAENLAFWAAAFAAPPGTVARAAEAFGLTSLLARRAADLSAGQKRRTGLARLPLTGRPLWLLDEPTVSLDADNVAAFARMVEAHLLGGGAAILATHIDLGLTGARILDISPFAAGQGGVRDPNADPFAEPLE